MILVNGVAAETVAATDRGLAYGDGVFRTLISRQGKPRWWTDQFRKLRQDCAALGIACPAQEVLSQEIERVTDTAIDEVVKIIVTRGSGARGYSPPAVAVPNRIVMSAPMPVYPPEFGRGGIKVRLCQTRLSSQPRLAGVKHLNRLENVLARSEWSDPSIPEGLLGDADGNIVCGIMTNLFIVESGRIVTPELARCGVAGVTRARIIAAAGKAGVTCHEETITHARLMDADEALLTNSVVGVWQIKECAGRNWKPGEHISRMREWLDDDRD
jgi:4-amino-4-deoxychorismate lyase